jgi:hypothetical protein
MVLDQWRLVEVQISVNQEFRRHLCTNTAWDPASAGTCDIDLLLLQRIAANFEVMHVSLSRWLVR